MKELRIYVIRTETVRKADLTLLKQRMPERFEKAARFRFERDSLLCLGGGLLLMNVLGIRDERDLRCGRHGRPYVPGLPSFSISHSGSFCILACGDAAHIGADIEEINERPLNIAKKVCTENELAWMQHDPLERFFQLWTWKESVMKATGMGLLLEPSSFDVLPFAEGMPARIMDRSWYACGQRLEKYCISACADEPIGEVRLLEYDDIMQKKKLLALALDEC